MIDRRTLAFTLLLVSFGAADAGAGDRPVAVSPGDRSRLLPIDDPCPTFSWGQVVGSDRYDLVVYEVAPERENAPVALRASIDGGAGSWTPPLGSCLERGGHYAWSLRARRDGAVSDWSAPAMFRVLPGPTATELEEALTVLRSHLGPADVAPRPASEDGDAGRATAAAGSADGGAPEDAARAGRERMGADPGVTALSVDGRIEALSFGGDGSGLANVQAAGLSCVGCVDATAIGDGAVTADKIGAACSAGQVLVRGPSSWECATLSAPACTPGDHIGCYTGPEGTLGVGECAAGSRVCAGDSSWGACSGEVLPAAAELCDGLDNTCDGPIDEGDPATLCPLTANATATLCDAAACSVTGCEALWADADGDYANGCEAPGAGACLEGGAPRAIVAPGEGELVIRELLADPAAPLGDADAEWFEVAARAGVDLNGLAIGTSFGTVIDTIDDADCLPVVDGDVLLFARSTDPAVNGGLAVDHTFGFSLVNGGGELHLAHGGDLVDAVSWTGGEVVAGRARSLPAAFESAVDNDDPANWCVVPADAGLLYSDGNHGTPGLANVDCP